MCSGAGGGAREEGGRTECGLGGMLRRGAVSRASSIAARGFSSFTGGEGGHLYRRACMLPACHEGLVTGEEGDREGGNKGEGGRGRFFPSPLSSYPQAPPLPPLHTPPHPPDPTCPPPPPHT